MDREDGGSTSTANRGYEASGRSSRLARFAAARPRITTYLEDYHRVHDFTCPDQKTDHAQQYANAVHDYLKYEAFRDSDIGNGQTYVHCQQDEPERVLGFYHLSSSKIQCSELTENQAIGLSEGPISVQAITWLGRHKEAPKDTGNALIFDAALRAADLRGVRGLVLTAATNLLVPYYEGAGFFPCRKAAKRLSSLAPEAVETQFLMFADLATILGA